MKMNGSCKNQFSITRVTTKVCTVLHLCQSWWRELWHMIMELRGAKAINTVVASVDKYQKKFPLAALYIQNGG